MREIGFSVSCYKGDLPLLRGCLASIRYYAPDAPICLVIDGTFDVKPFVKAYDIIPIYRQQVRNPDLRRWSYGFGITKMVAFWEAPFEYVFHIDADCVMWGGDVRSNLPSDEWDVVYNEPHETITPYIQRTQYFDPDQIFNYIPFFPWQGNPYFQAGVVAIKKGVLDLDEYMRMLEGQRRYPEIFVNGDQGMLNILVFRALKEGRLKAFSTHLQTVIPVCQPSDLNQQFYIHSNQPHSVSNPTVLHWAGPKPYLKERHPFSDPMTFFRGKGMRECGLPSWLPVQLGMRFDEFTCRSLPRFKQRIKKSLPSSPF